MTCIRLCTLYIVEAGLEPTSLLTQGVFQRSVAQIHESHIHKHAAPRFPLGLCQEENEGEGGGSERDTHRKTEQRPCTLQLRKYDESPEFQWDCSNITAIYDLT